MNYKVISETYIGVLVEHEDDATACKLCKYTNPECHKNEAIDCRGGRFLTTEEENEFHKTKQLCK